MSRTADQIIDEARILPPEERVRVAEELLRSIEGPEQAEIDAAWAKEAEERLTRFRTGKTSAVPVDDAIEEVRQILKVRRS